MYYLQSRYYDPFTGRFVNSDNTEMLSVRISISACNLFSYCENDLVNETDTSGELLQSVLFNIFAGVICGLLIQLFDDLLGYFINRIVNGKQNVRFELCIGDYISSAVEWTLDFVNPFKKSKVVGKAISAYLPFAIKYGYKFLRGSKIESHSFWTDLLFTTLSFVVSLVLSQARKNKIKKIKKHGKTKREINLQKIEIKKSFKVCGEKISFYISLTEDVVEFIYKWVVAIKGV